MKGSRPPLLKGKVLWKSHRNNVIQTPTILTWFCLKLWTGFTFRVSHSTVTVSGSLEKSCQQQQWSSECAGYWKSHPALFFFQKAYIFLPERTEVQPVLWHPHCPGSYSWDFDSLQLIEQYWMKELDISNKEETQECCPIWYCLAPEFSFLITALSPHTTVFEEIVKNVISNSMLKTSMVFWGGLTHLRISRDDSGMLLTSSAKQGFKKGCGKWRQQKYYLQSKMCLGFYLDQPAARHSKRCSGK